ncbi:hypothetical protein [Shewanella phaeophyticola]|uniref:Uncharacterized protein n=1 Tax=Shewanella phaeophyticola TaxID=2978345 RepID=A0ABT2NZD1_9GAMM|nr:hypothetical protein [Shewanella sp. KJ10-1]MCT8985733.1 hypothetical protein [Shewanella sp. KJ10-1]
MSVNQTAQQRLIILDPGLRELGGHHPATVLAIADAFTNNEQVSIELLCHQDCPTAFTENLNGKVKVTHHFATDFYQYFYQLPSNQALQQYCNRLALEYISAIKLCLSGINKKNKKNQKIMFWCHTLNWQHAKALALALDVLKQNHEAEYVAEIAIIVGLMYSPLDSIKSIKRKMHYELAFRHLAKHDSVKFFAVDYELQKQYSSLLNKYVDIQPCLLVGESQKNNHNINQQINVYHLGVITADNVKDRSDNNQVTIILYTGDAKLNKGFSELPNITGILLANTSNYQFVIQYSITNDSTILSETDIKLKSLASEHSNLTVINQFLEHHELIELFKAGDAILFNYDPEVYQYQSSGVLWLAAYHQLDILNMTKNWISREAERLNLTHFYCNSIIKLNKTLVNIRPKSLKVTKVVNPKEPVGEKNNTYSDKLFVALSEWFNNIVD